MAIKRPLSPTLVRDSYFSFDLVSRLSKDVQLQLSIDRVHARVKRNKWLRAFTVFTRIIIAIAFIPSGLTKALGHRFTILGTDNPVGFFFEALYRTGFYWRFLGLCQLAAALLLLIPRTATVGAVMFFPLILNIFVITISLHFQGTPFITGLMLLANIYLLCWDYDRLKGLVK